eukprot:CAMPEP_0184679552 /NCGR_PEP_ID=MMETSP0312-20130426/2391_1 /TAXON_ID=31354 /ORGANISM="Compsopogon coeruleus, Strain SAG 36.94" /LENGTH=863 /DNA_ID=CAMNT_0027129069 /DNA_START=20 /DNA_END=2612 /DNA_ORIENTATION=-
MECTSTGDDGGSSFVPDAASVGDSGDRVTDSCRGGGERVGTTDPTGDAIQGIDCGVECGAGNAGASRVCVGGFASVVSSGSRAAYATHGADQGTAPTAIPANFGGERCDAGGASGAGDDEETDQELSERKKVYAIGSMLKLIVETPEFLFVRVGSRELQAARLLEAACRFSDSAAAVRKLKQDESAKPSLAFVESQWATIESFRSQILARAKNSIENSIDVSEVARAMAAYVSICDPDHEGAVGDVIDIYFASQGRQLKDLVESGRILDAARAVSESVDAVFSIFLDEQACEDDWRIRSLLRSSPTISPRAIDALPTRADVDSTFQSWLETVWDCLQRNGPGSLTGITTPAAVSRLYSDLVQVFKPQTEHIVDEEKGRILTQLLEGFETPVFFRSEAIASDCVGNAIDTVQSSFQNKLDKLCENESSEEQDTTYSRFSLKKRRKTKWMDLSSAVVDEFEQQLLAMEADLVALFSAIPRAAVAFQQALVACAPLLEHCLGNTLSVLENEEDREPQLVVHQALFTARVAGLLHVSHASRRIFSLGAQPGDPSLTELTPTKFFDSMRDISFAGHKIWANLTAHSLSKYFESQLLSAPLGSIHHKIGWETTSARSDEGIQGPSSVSSALFQYLIGGCAAVAAAGGSSLPTFAITVFPTRMCSHFVDVLSTSLVDDWPSGHEELTQLYFDVRFMMTFLRSPQMQKHQPDLVRSMQDLLADIKGRMDPIEFAAMEKHIVEGVDLFAARTQVILGAMREFSEDRAKPVLRPGLPVTKNDSSTFFIPLAPTVPRMALLPAPTPSNVSIRALGSSRTPMTFESGGPGNKEGTPTATGDVGVVDLASNIGSHVGRFGSKFFQSISGIGGTMRS